MCCSCAGACSWELITGCACLRELPGRGAESRGPNPHPGPPPASARSLRSGEDALLAHTQPLPRAGLALRKPTVSGGGGTDGHGTHTHTDTSSSRSARAQATPAALPQQSASSHHLSGMGRNGRSLRTCEAKYVSFLPPRQPGGDVAGAPS